MLSRSTKGASKLRRELINVEISSIRDLLPLQEGIRKRLSQLQIMATCKAFIGKNNFFAKVPELGGPESDANSRRSHFDFSQALPGFLLLASDEGKLLYLSDNVMEILGHSMVDFITQSESAFDLFDDRGQSNLEELLSGVHDDGQTVLPGSASTEYLTDEMTFTCLMGLSKNARRHPGLDRLKAMKVRARLLKPSNYLTDSAPVLAAFCTPCSPVFPAGERAPVFNTMVCQSGHGMDMKFLNIDSNLQSHLGYAFSELEARSWYEFIHPEHESEFVSKHLELVSNGSNFISSVFVRVQTKHGHFIWLHMLMRLNHHGDGFSGQSEIACVSHVLEEYEVAFAREREHLDAEMNQLVSNTPFDSTGNSGYPFEMDAQFLAAPAAYYGPGAVWKNEVEEEGEDGLRLKRKATGGSVNGKARKSARMQVEDDSASSTSASTSSYPSPAHFEVDQFGQLEAFPVAGYRDRYQADFELNSEDRFHPNALSPYSVVSDSLSSNSPRMMHMEDDNSFFASIPVSLKNNNSISSSSSIKRDQIAELLGDFEGLTNPDIVITLPSPTQEVPRELPELNLADLFDYLRTVEDGKKQDACPSIFPPSYAECSGGGGWQQSMTGAQNRPPASSPTVAYNYQTMHGPESYFGRTEPGLAQNGVNGGAADFSGPAFLERLIESPEFTELIGMISGGSQKRTGLPERRGLLPSYG